LLSVSGPGEGYDVLHVLRWEVFSKGHILLLLQILTVFLVTLACMFAGPLAKVSLRNTLTVSLKEVEVLQAWNAFEAIGNRISANVEWNDTMTSLDAARYPYDRLMDYLPPSALPWTFTPDEWEPTWSADCNFQDETMLQDLVASGTATFWEPLDAFPSFRDTYNSLWLDRDEFRLEANNAGDFAYTEEGEIYMNDMIIWVLLQSEPMVNDRAFANNETLRLSVSALHVKGFQVLTYDDPTNGGVMQWKPNGTIANASYTRMECDISRKPVVLDEEAVPWVWSNDTFAITDAYRMFWTTYVGETSMENLPVVPPTPHELFRFYQAYIVSVNTWKARSYSRKLSIWTDTVQLSITCLTLILLLVMLELWLTVRYFWFLRKNKRQLQQSCIPDGKIDWMVYNARLAQQFATELRSENEKPPKDRDYFRGASFGNGFNPQTQPSGLAQVYTSPTLTPATSRGDVRTSVLRKTTRSMLPRIVVPLADEEIDGGDKDGCELRRIPSSVDSALSSDCGNSHCQSPDPEAMLKPQVSQRSSITISKPSPHNECSSPRVSVYPKVKHGNSLDAITPVTPLTPIASTNVRSQEEQVVLPTTHDA
jgi:hypothetical protein